MTLRDLPRDHEVLGSTGNAHQAADIAAAGSGLAEGLELDFVDADIPVAFDLDSRIKSARILIVDDNAANCMLLHDVLRRDGYVQPEVTRDPRVVVSLHGRKKFDLILLDIRMPHMDGFEVMSALKQRAGEDFIPVLVLTAQTDQETRLRALQMGAMDFLSKPFNRVEVLHRIRNMLKVRILYNLERWHSEILENKVLARTRELNETRMEIIRRLGRAGEYRDNETGNHVIRMSKSCQLVAQAWGLSNGECDVILNASPMHDVGKIGIPDRILLKPGRLTPDEWEVMKTHAEMGAQILGQHPFEIMRVARDIALHHHERWDGGGYPHGLKGESIPIGARIAAICDVFDALQSERPYKPAWDLEKTLSYMKDHTGSHFDPNIMSCFLTAMPAIQNMRKSYSDED